MPDGFSRVDKGELNPSAQFVNQRPSMSNGGGAEACCVQIRVEETVPSSRVVYEDNASSHDIQVIFPLIDAWLIELDAGDVSGTF